MSRYSLTHKSEPKLEVFVGWDRAFQSFFLQVFDPTLPEELNDCIVDRGSRRSDLFPEIEEIITLADEYVDIGDDLHKKVFDRMLIDKAEQGPETLSPLQEAMKVMFEGLSNGR